MPDIEAVEAIQTALSKFFSFGAAMFFKRSFGARTYRVDTVSDDGKEIGREVADTAAERLALPERRDEVRDRRAERRRSADEFTIAYPYRRPLGDTAHRQIILAARREIFKSLDIVERDAARLFRFEPVPVTERFRGEKTRLFTKTYRTRNIVYRGKYGFADGRGGFHF